eukprot:scaffold63650_cov83-Phaeocystis_antarctica.AAC.3
MVVGAAKPLKRVDVGRGFVFDIVGVRLRHCPVDKGDGEVRQQGKGGHIVPPQRQPQLLPWDHVHPCTDT